MTFEVRQPLTKATVTQDDVKYFNAHGRWPAHVELPAVKTAADLLAEQEEAARTPFYSHLLKAEQARKRGGRFDGLAGGQRSERGVMNKTEARYARELDALKEAGWISWWRFEAFRLRVTDPVAGKACWLTPDFWTDHVEGQERIIDVKGRVVNDASVLRLKACAMAYPERKFFLAQWLGEKAGGWKLTEVSALRRE